ncbi:cache domain-containing protein [Paenibacillus sp. YN15]|uniref:cache domain-containing protein n=1 Tax=Paenibacillus sp. YN15 TaxID=1742774 RepID=UPI0015ECBE00|nr:helix-turn-helix domain-containing protein [Paenibacillus sp. YN15]
MKVSMSTRVMMVYGGILLLFILLTFLFSYWGTVGGLQHQLKETNLALLKQIDQKIEMSFQQSEKDLLQLTEELEFVYFMNDSYKDDSQRYVNFVNLRTKISSFMTKNMRFSSIFVYSDKTGNLLTDRSYMGKEESDNQWLTDYLDKEGYFWWLPTHKIWDGTKNRDVVTLIRPYPSLSAPGYRRGLLAVNIDENELHQMIRDIYEGDSFQGHSFIIDGQGEVVTHDDKSKIYSNMKELPYMQTLLARQGDGSFATDIDNVRQTVFYKKSPYTGWTIVTVVPEAQVYRSLIFTRNLFIVLTAVMSAAALALVFVFNRRTFRPIDRVLGKLAGRYQAAPVGRSVQGTSYLESIIDQMFLDRDNLEHQVRESKPVLKWRIVMDILTGYRTTYAKARHHLEYLGIRLFPNRFLAASAETSKEGGIDPKDETLYTYCLCNVAEEIINMENAGVAIDLGGGRAAILFSFAEGDEEQNVLRATALLEQIQEVMKKQIGIMVTVGIGRCYEDLKQAAESYEESQLALRYKMVTGPHTVISIEDLQSTDNLGYYRMLQMVDRVLETLKLNDPSRMKELLEEAFQEAVKGSLSPELIKQFSFELVMRAMQTMESLGISAEDTLTRVGNVHERIHQCEDWRQTEQLVSTLLEELAAIIGDRRNQRGKKEIIDQVLVYIQEHYSDHSLSLDRLAEEFNMSPTYISKLFKEYAEGNFIDYLIEVRIEAAKRLLENKNAKIGDIAASVGYANSRSFMRSFKKCTGLTTTEYRERFARGKTS